MPKTKDSCNLVYAMLEKIQDLLPPDCPEEKLRETVQKHCGVAISTLRGRGLGALAEQARQTLSTKGLEFSIVFRKNNLVIQIDNCPSAAVEDACCCRFAHVFFDEICQWAGYNVEIQRVVPEGRCTQIFRREKGEGTGQKG